MIYYTSVNVQWGSIDLNDVKEMRFEESEIEKYTVTKHDLLICEGGDVGRCCVWSEEKCVRRSGGASIPQVMVH